jgi:alpha-L-fucosidase
MKQKKYFNKALTLAVLCLAAAAPLSAQQDEKPLGNYAVINSGETAEQIIAKAANVTPSPRQYEWQKLEMTGFIHFGINTFTEVEWGSHGTDISIFNPAELNAAQWVKTMKGAGIKLIILTTKHHDGFCLWPSKYTEYDIENTPYKSGKGDVVRELADACHKAGIKFGVYLSPWDMNEPSYGTEKYNEHFRNQLTELLTNYGEVSEVWFDGANGEGPNGKKQVYDWQATYRLIRKLQPNAVIAIMGPDVRWVGTESGYGRQTEWSVLPGAKMNQEEIAANSQQAPGDGAFIPGNLMNDDLGSRAILNSASSLIWYPSETDVSIRPGWFYKEEENALIKDPYKLMDIYYNSVGLNSVLLLNVPPDKRGLIRGEDIASLKDFRYLLDETFKTNIAAHAKIKASSEKKGTSVNYILDDDFGTYWSAKNGESSASIEIDLGKEQTFNRAMLQENILVGQRVEKFHLEYWDGTKWNQLASATTIGYKRLLRFPVIRTDQIKIVIDENRLNPTLASFGLYLAPPEVSFTPESGAFAETMEVKLASDQPDAKIYYTLDGSEPNINSSLYKAPIELEETTALAAIAVSPDGKKSLHVKRQYNKAKYGITINAPYNEKYTAGGDLALVDGMTGSSGFGDGKWQGYYGSDLDVTLDLRERKEIKNLSINFLRDTGSWLFLPDSVEYFTSDDGKNFTKLGAVANNGSNLDEKKIIKSFQLKPVSAEGRYIRIIGKNIGVCPPGHKGAGDKAWIFADEITVE